MQHLKKQSGEALTIFLVVVPLIFGGVEHLRANHHKEKAEQYQKQAEQLAEIASKNEDNARIAAEAAEQNATIAKNISNDLQQCLAISEKYKLVESAYVSDNEALADYIEELEGRIADTDLSDCRVPGWLVDEITKRDDGL